MSRSPSTRPSLGHRLSHSILTWVIGAILLALIVGSLRIGGHPIIPKPVGNVFATFSDLFSQFLSFSIPLIIIGLVTPAIADLGRGAGKWLRSHDGSGLHLHPLRRFPHFPGVRRHLPAAARRNLSG